MVRNGKIKIRRTKADAVFDTVNYIIMALLIFIFLYPLYYTLIASFSDINELALGNVFLLPKGFTLNAYKNVFINDSIWIGYKNSIIYTAGATLYQLALLLPLSYALSKKYLFCRGAVTWFFLVTMYFSGGLIPTYLLIKSLGLINNRLVLIVGGISTYNMIVTRTFFSSSIPDEIYESARIDGANEFYCFFRIALPLSGAIVAVMALFTAVGAWNAYFGALIYTTKKELFPLQLVLRNILIVGDQMIQSPEFVNMSDVEQGYFIAQSRMAQTMKYAVVFIASAPLLVAYPFVQRFFVKGVMIGSVKG